MECIFLHFRTLILIWQIWPIFLIFLVWGLYFFSFILVNDFWWYLWNKWPNLKRLFYSNRLMSTFCASESHSETCLFSCIGSWRWIINYYWFLHFSVTSSVEWLTMLLQALWFFLIKSQFPWQILIHMNWNIHCLM